ncbi:MBL fold metallo-hydrolase [Oculatella sp. LEGE 06141]|nr:MBL fold metallo-hydrolase [Oculatella sp. LEGE 06141]
MFDTVFAFAPNRDTMGGTAYFILENSGHILVDCPAWDDTTQRFLHEQGGVRWLFLTHRGAIAHAKAIQQAFDCEVVIQEQEAYLLPEVKVTPFHRELQVSPHTEAVWTSGHTPGSACLYHDRHGGILFSGRHLLPNQQGHPTPLRIAKTFHWRRQLQSVQQLLDRYDAEQLQSICPGANTGFLRGQRRIDRAYEQLQTLDLTALLDAKPLL